MLSQTYIGKYYEGSQELSVSTKSIPGQDNDSYVILGESGYGKSVAAQSIVLQKANQSYSVRSIDIHNSSAPEHLFPIFRKSFEHLSSQIDAYNTPIPTTLFEPLHYADGTMESPADLSYTLSNIIARHLRLSRSSTTALSESLEYAISDRDNNPDIFPAVLKALEEFDTKASRNAMAYLAPLLRHNIFRHQSVNYSFGIENISLSKFPPLFKNVIVDLLLFDEFRTASQGGQPPRYIYIDEMQNLSIDKDCYLGKILTEGRKYSLNVIYELLHFKHEDFHRTESGAYLIGGCKTEAGRNRIIPILDFGIPIFEHAYATSVENGPLFPNGKGGFWNEKNWRNRKFYPFLEEIGIQPNPYDENGKRKPEFAGKLATYTPYTTRHTYASLCDRAGVNKDILKRAVGHTPKSKTLDEVYLHPKATQMIEAFDKANQLVNDEVLTTTKA